MPKRKPWITMYNYLAVVRFRWNAFDFRWLFLPNVASYLKIVHKGDSAHSFHHHTIIQCFSHGYFRFVRLPEINFQYNHHFHAYFNLFLTSAYLLSHFPTHPYHTILSTSLTEITQFSANSRRKTSWLTWQYHPKYIWNMRKAE